MLQEQPSSVGAFNGSPKTMFYLGLFVGVSSVSTLALAVLVGLLVSGKGLTVPGVAAQGGSPQVAAAPSPIPTPDAPPAGPLKPVDDKTDHIRGDKNAKVTLVEYSDFECPFCLRHHDSLQQILKDYPKDVRLVYRHFPLSFHPEAQKAAEASECAGKQGKFWEMHEKVFEANKSQSMSVATWKAAARQLGLNGDAFDKCLDSGETAARVAQDLQEGTTAGVGGTPGTFVNGQLIEGAVPVTTLKQAIDAALKG
ncbi:DsbA family protein [Candidatus Uhrbacteria bacterium]|nr:DsbA family protein [Candidatus Uhrbacteria bacterium]